MHALLVLRVKGTRHVLLAVGVGLASLAIVACGSDEPVGEDLSSSGSVPNVSSGSTGIEPAEPGWTLISEEINLVLATPDLREYVDTGAYTPQQFYLQGLWTNGPESIIHARETNDLEDHLAFQFVGRSANVVIDPAGPEPFDVFVEIDDRPLKSEEAGSDVMFDDQGRSYFTVEEAKLYAFLEVPEFGKYIVKLASNSDNFAIFAFTFGINEGGI